MDDPGHERQQVILGLDTHAELHVAAALDERGRLLDTCTIPTTSTEFRELVHWASHYGEVVQVGMEGTGRYGAGLARWLRARQLVVIEVDRPDRRIRRRRGKSDTLDAEAAARAVLAGTATAQPKAGKGAMALVRTLRVARQSAIKARTQAANERHSLVVTAPEAVRTQLRRLTLHQFVRTAAAFRPSTELSTPTAATKLALKSIAIRYQHLSAEMMSWTTISTSWSLRQHRHCWRSKASVLTWPPRCSPSPETTQNDGRAREGAFAHLVGVAPIEASSGKITRHRLDRGGDRQGNRALYLLAVGRRRWDPATRAYVNRRTAEGRTKPEIIRCLKRYIARELYPVLLATTSTLVHPDRSTTSSTAA